MTEIFWQFCFLKSWLYSFDQTTVLRTAWQLGCRDNYEMLIRSDQYQVSNRHVSEDINYEIINLL